MLTKMNCSYCHAADHWRCDKKTGVLLCPKLIRKEKKLQQQAAIKARTAKIARIEAEERALLPPAVASEIVVPEYSQFYQEKIDYWNDTRFEPVLAPTHCPFSTVSRALY
tara:strand:- start:689 stop:1018 length:330 start_codon:yes stop_codon:yes gene_type:complete